MGNNDNNEGQALFSPGQHWNLLLNLETHTIILLLLFLPLEIYCKCSKSGMRF